ncbi:MAG: hypothetical protein EA362_08600 [Saprospirales bacterium]|nr:MAG: hypothetical protein EA362_08600 [Saprospirales bacterium]
MKNLSDTMIVLGLMSGSSLDGTDIGIFKFTENSDGSDPDIEWLKTQTNAYPDHLKEKLKRSDQLPLESYFELEAELSRYYGQLIREIKNEGHSIDLVSVHGHTVFHQPDKGFSIQMGLGGIIAENAGVPVVTDFRNNAIALGWQGAPMVPILDHLFKSKADFFLNLGGIANLSIIEDKYTLSMDVCGCNQVLDFLAAQAGMEYDENGKMASKGNTDTELLSKFNEFDFLQQKAPKSLSNQQIRSYYIPLLRNNHLPVEDKMRTMVEHIVEAIALELKSGSEGHPKKMMVSGGGAHHLTLMERLKKELAAFNIEIIVPDNNFIDFKESLLMAYAGWLRWRGVSNFIPENHENTLEVYGGGVYLPANFKTNNKK